MEEELEPLHPSGTTPLTTMEKKAIRDNYQKHGGKKQKMRVALLMNKKIKAFKGWKTEPKPWSYQTVYKYVDWCHINKLFPLCRHKQHVKQNKANLAYVKDQDFMIRCCQVWHQLYLEQKTYRNNDFAFYLVKMVYTKLVLKKKVDWRIIYEVPIKVRPKTASLLWGNDTIDLTKMLSGVKRGKTFVPDELVQWSATSSLDEHTHKYNNHSFESNNDDFFMTKARENDPKVQFKKSKVEGDNIAPSSSDEVMNAVEIVHEIPPLTKPHHSGVENNSRDNKPEMVKRINKAISDLNVKNEELKVLKLREANPTYKDLLRQHEKCLMKIIEENDKDFFEFSRTQVLYYKETALGKRHTIDAYDFWQCKLETLQQRWQQAKKRRQILELQIKEREQEYAEAAFHMLQEVDGNAKSKEYGCIPKELLLLQQCTKLCEDKGKMLKTQIGEVKAKNNYCRHWNSWFDTVIRIEGLRKEDILKMHLELVLHDFLPEKERT